MSRCFFSFPSAQLWSPLISRCRYRDRPQLQAHPANSRGARRVPGRNVAPRKSLDTRELPGDGVAYPAKLLDSLYVVT